MDGTSFAIISRFFPDTLERILINGSIYARMSPDQKAQLVERLIGLGYGAAMCGDGANDCSALKAAHVGISLSEAEASVAAPFTSKVFSI
jgi:P-type E1-E2 ATPase